MQVATDKSVILEDQETLEEDAPQMGKFNEDEANQQHLAEKERGDRLTVLDDAIEEKKGEYETLSRSVDDVRVIQAQEEKDHKAKIAGIDQLIKARTRESTQKENELNDREQNLDRREGVLDRDRAQFTAEREKVGGELETATTELAAATQELTDTDAAIGEANDKRKKLDADYLEAQDAYAQQISKKIERRDAVARELATLEGEKATLAKEIKTKETALKARERAIKGKERTLAKREKIADDKDRMVADKYATLQSAIKEWQSKGVPMPKKLVP